MKLHKMLQEKKLTALVVFVTLLWGVSWVCAKYLATRMPLMELTFWRFVVTAIFSYITLLLFGQKSLTVKKESIVWLASGGLFMGIAQLVNFAGLEVGYAGIASIIFNATSPLFSFLLAFLFFKLELSNIEIFALMLGCFGALVIFHFWRLDLSQVLKGGNFYFIINSLGFALVTLCSQKASEFASASSFTFYMSLIGCLIVLPFCDFGTIMSVFHKDTYFILNLIFMAGVAGGFGTTAYFFAVGKLGSAKSSSFIFLVPIGSVVCGYFAFDESIEVWSVVGGFLSLFAVYLLSKPKVTIIHDK